MRRLLLVEDNDLVGRAFQTLVGELVKIVWVTSLRAARRELRSTRWAAAVIDLSLPDGSGLEALELARERGYKGPALVFSAYHDPADINRAYALGAKYLVKPATPEDVREFVVDALKRGRTAPVDVWRARYKLTRAESAILKAAADGWSRDQIATRRRTSLKTTKKQIHNMLGKTGDASLIAAAARLLRESR